MTAIYRLRVPWTGVGGSNGLSTFYLRGGVGSSDPTAISNFFVAIRSLLPTGLTITVPNSGDVLEDTTGALTSGWTAGSAGGTTGNGGTNFPAGTGCAVTWSTGVVVDGHRLRGRTFIAPITTAFFDTDGTLTATVATTINAAGATLIAAVPSLAVWHRPRKTPARAGSSAVITGASTADLVRSLRSRRS